MCVCFESSIYRDGDIVNLQQVMADVTKELKYDPNNITNYILCIYTRSVQFLSSGENPI